MVYINNSLSQCYSAESLPAAVRAAIGKPLRRAAPLTQLALVGALAALPENHPQLPVALLWQSTSGPRTETQVLLHEVCSGSGEPMPYDFLATQPTIAAAQIQPLIPGLQSATYFPLAVEGIAQWTLLINLALNWLEEGRYAHVLCAHLDWRQEIAASHWLSLSKQPLEKAAFKLQLSSDAQTAILPDTPDFPEQLRKAPDQTIILQSPAAYRQALEFTRI